jgi:hypothetical protein
MWHCSVFLPQEEPAASGAAHGYDDWMTPGMLGEAETLRRLVDEYRVRCLWFLREGDYPETRAETWRVLDAIQRYGRRRVPACGSGEAMALNLFQQDVCRLLARTE